MAEKVITTAKKQETKQKCSNSCKQKPGFKSSESSVDIILQLQRTAGNQAVQGLIKSRALQVKLRIGQPNDIYEQKANRVAEQVVKTPDIVLQSKNCAKCDENKERLLQAKESTEQTLVTQDQDVSYKVQKVLRSPCQPLDPTTRSFMEPRFGYDFSNVRVHSGAAAEQSARDMNAQAYTVGHHVVFNSGKLAPRTHEGKRLIEHELTHVVQQTGNLNRQNTAGRVHQPNGQLSGAQWVNQFPQSTSIDDLMEPFRTNVNNFVSALRAAGAVVHISTTFRPPERAYLMHYSFRIANNTLNPANVPRHPRVNITWLHRDDKGNPDLNASRQAANAMVTGYNIAFAPALHTRHTQGQAIDMTISWRGNLNIVNGNGAVVHITSQPRNGGNADLHTVGRTYSVIKLVKDPPHWSNDGH